MKRIACTGLTILALVLIAFVAASIVPTSVRAKEPKAGILDFLDHSVGGEPGEDPHLRTGPEERAIYIEGTWADNSKTDEDILRRGNGSRMLDGMTSTGISRSKWRMIITIWIMSIVSR
jgi:hypothetical protein